MHLSKEDYMNENNEIKHYGVLGMRWGHRKAAKEREALIKDAKSIKDKAAPGQTKMVMGKYRQRRFGRLYFAHHIVDEYGKVKLSYLSGNHGEHYVAAGKEYVDKYINLKDHFYNTKNLNVEYDVYE